MTGSDVGLPRGGAANAVVPTRDPAPLPTRADPDALARLAEAEDTLRAIRAGEVDAFVVADPASGQRVRTLSTADRPYRMLVEHMRDGAATLSATGLILFANGRLADLLGRSREVIVGSPLARFVVGGGVDFEHAVGADGGGATFELELIAADGRIVPVQVRSSPLTVDSDVMTCLTFTDLSVHVAKDREIARLAEAQVARMSDLQGAQAALARLATHDPLTGLPNRLLLVDRIDRALAQAKRSGRCTAVLFVDLDRFKQVNDADGHGAGDAVLRRAAIRLLAALRPMDTVARIGGDEFVVLAPDVLSQPHAVEIGTRLVDELARRPEPTPDAERIPASVGIAVSEAGRGTAETLLDEAVAGMCQAKFLGGGRAVLFDAALARRAKLRSSSAGMLKAALDEHRIAVHYQPIVDVASRNVAGFEALARIRQPDGSITPPAEFIPAAEESGLVVPLGLQVLEVACHEASAWQMSNAEARGLTVAVNLSPRQFDGGDLVPVVARTLEQTGLDPRFLHLELTETAIIDLRPGIVEQLELIRDLGVQIGLDDFGTGYASLTHLRRLPLTFVKIDQSFVQGLGINKEDERIVAAVIDLAGNLRLRSIAEGVESEIQLKRLRELGADQAQGYVFARPLPPEDAVFARAAYSGAPVG